MKNVKNCIKESKTITKRCSTELVLLLENQGSPNITLNSVRFNKEGLSDKISLFSRKIRSKHRIILNSYWSRR